MYPHPNDPRDRVTPAVMARLTEPPAPVEELAVQLIARAELSRARRRRRQQPPSQLATAALDAR